MWGDDLVIMFTALALMLQSTPVSSTINNGLDYFECWASALLGVSRWDREGRLRTDKAEIGKFVQGFEGVLSGPLIHVVNGHDDTGCSLQWTNVPLASVNKSPWIALVSRGGCNFQRKILNAEKNNASGIIVYNSQDKTRLGVPRIQRHRSSLSSKTIVAVITYRWKGEELIRLLKESVGVNAFLSVANPCADVESGEDDDETLSSKLICLLFLALLLAFILFSCISLYAVQKYQTKTKMRHTSFYTPDERALAKIPRRSLKSTDKIVNDKGECCAVCIDPYYAGDIVRILTCSHEFHQTCIDPWLLEHRTCPMCKVDILRKFGSVFTGSQESIIQVMDDEGGRDSSARVTIQEEREDAEESARPQEGAVSTTAEGVASITKAPSGGDESVKNDGVQLKS